MGSLPKATAGIRMPEHRVLSPVLLQLHFAASPESRRGNGRKAGKVVATPTFVDDCDQRGERHPDKQRSGTCSSLTENTGPSGASASLLGVPPAPAWGLSGGA